METHSGGIYHGGVSELGPLARLFRYRASLFQLTGRAIKVRYRRSLLGLAWALAYPLLAVLVLTLVFGRLFSGVPSYPVYVLTGMLAWGFFSLGTLQATDALFGGGPILRKVYVPTAVFPLSAVTANLVNLLLALLVVPAVMVAVGAPLTLRPLELVTGIASLAAFTTGAALVLAATNLFFNDVRYFFEALLLLWFYASPVVYPPSLIPSELAMFLWANPFYWILDLIRAGLIDGLTSSPYALTVAPLGGLLALTGGWLLFARLERSFHLYL